MKTDHIKEENNKADFFCEKCDREFKTVEKYKEHCDTHRVVSFILIRRLVSKSKLNCF